MACGILVPQPEIKPMPPPPVEAWSLNHWTTREVPIFLYFEMYNTMLLTIGTMLYSRSLELIYLA